MDITVASVTGTGCHAWAPAGIEIGIGAGIDGSAVSRQGCICRAHIQDVDGSIIEAPIHGVHGHGLIGVHTVTIIAGLTRGTLDIEARIFDASAHAAHSASWTVAVQAAVGSAVAGLWVTDLGLGAFVLGAWILYALTPAAALPSGTFHISTRRHTDTLNAVEVFAFAHHATTRIGNAHTVDANLAFWTAFDVAVGFDADPIGAHCALGTTDTDAVGFDALAIVAECAFGALDAPTSVFDAEIIDTE